MYFVYNKNKNAFDMSPNKNPSIIPQVVWVVSDKCPFSCPFCFQPKTNTDYDICRIDESISLFQKLGVQRIDISGGEPLVFSKLSYFCSNLYRNGFNLTLSSNGWAQPPLTNWLKQNYNIFVRVLFSLNAPSAQEHDRICNKEGAYDNLIALIDDLRKAGLHKIRINTVLSSLFLEVDVLNRMIELISALCPIEWCIIQPHPENKKSTFDAYDISENQFITLFKYVQKKFNTNAVKLISRTIENYSNYWILNPNNTFFLHTDGTIPPRYFEFTSANFTKIFEAAMNKMIKLPAN